MKPLSFLCGVTVALSTLAASSAYVSTFVPKKGVVAPMPKAVTNSINNNGSPRRSSNRNDIKMMPIGVPKVAYRVPNSGGAEWSVFIFLIIWIFTLI